MEGTEKLRVSLPHWIEHNGEHVGEFRAWADRAEGARNALLDAARLLEEANTQLQEGLEKSGGPLKQQHG